MLQGPEKNERFLVGVGAQLKWLRAVGAEAVKTSLTFIQENKELQKEIGRIVPPIQKEQDFQRC